MAEPENGKAVIASLRPDRPVKSVTLLGRDAPLSFSQSAEELTITLPSDARPQLANVYRMEI